MSAERAATVYATALFGAARDGAVVDRVRADLDSFAASFAGSVELRRALLDPQIDTQQKASAVVALTADADPRVANMVRLLLAKGRLGMLPDLTREYDRLAREDAAVVEVEVVSAVPLPEPIRDQLRERIQALTRRTARLVHTVDPAIVGGLSLRVGDDVVVDASIRARVERLRETLARASMRGASE
ncbi:MAG: ATP synthase F1 subunit delta [Actinobacteria bacterium]|nr:ATP synthase F1 subunit delta [Actinomycetota bacterium]